MNIGITEVTTQQFIWGLEQLKNILSKAQGFAETKKIDMSVLFNTRLIADQFPLSRQIQITCDTAKMFVGRLTNLEVPSFKDEETTLEEFMKRIDNTIAVLEKVKPEHFSGYESKKITSSFKPGMVMDGKTYLIQHAIPNFNFHFTTAYSILRSNGVDIGKNDYLGPIWKQG
ncbi:MAG: DUF1993 domain-containing protein [Bdellovibrionota bacterium]